MNSMSRAAMILGAMPVLACGGGETPRADSTPVIPPVADSAAGASLTPFQLEHGIGPLTEPLTLGAVDQAMVARGKTAFETYCLTCHRLTEDFLGPALGEVTTRRSPTYIMNMILNPTEMGERHPVAKELVTKFPTPMIKLVNSSDDARAIVEYLRTEAKGTVKTQ
jgi:cytochrome c